MSDFTLLRFQECSRTLTARLTEHRKWLVFWFCAVMVLFLNLGMNGAMASEARWMSIVREMLQTGDWLHPCINGQAYFDKPLVSYWLIGLVSFGTHGVVTEMTARTPSALSGLLGLYSAIVLARKVYSEKAAWLTGWLMLTTFSFVFWSRLAEADMENCVFILTAAAWYMHCREKAGFLHYLLFWALCAVGAQTKGLAAIVLPPCIAAIDMFLNSSWKKHLKWSSVLALLCGIGIYFVPFLLESFSRKNYGASGLVLVFRENLVRAVNPWDHNKDPFWIYFIYLPRLLIPWIPFFVLAIADAVRRVLAKKSFSKEEQWLWYSIIFLFVLFSASKSRRVYYILPIVPFCVIQTAAFLSDPEKGLFQNISRWIFRIADYLIPVTGIVLSVTSPIVRLVVCPVFFPAQAEYPVWFFPLFDLFLPAVGIVLLIWWFCSFIRMKKGTAVCCFADHVYELNRVIPFAAAAFLLTAGILIPLFGSNAAFRTEKTFYRMIRKEYIDKYGITPDRIAFFNRNLADASYYLALPAPVQVFGFKENTKANRGFFSDTTEVAGPEKFREFLKEIRKTGGMVFLRADDVQHKEFPEDLRKEFSWVPGGQNENCMMEPFTLVQQKSFENRGKWTDKQKKHAFYHKKKLCRIYLPANQTLKE